MAVAIVQEQGTASGSTVSSIQPTLASGATAGNLLIAVLGKASDAVVTHTSWTRLYSITAEGSVERGVVVWTVASGGETNGPSFSWTGAVGACAWIAELSGADTTTPLNASSTPQGNSANVTSRSSGTTGTTTAAGLGIGVFVGGGAMLSRSYTNSYTEADYQQSGSVNRSLAIVTKAIASSATTETTASWTDAVPCRAGAIVIGEAAAGATPKGRRLLLHGVGR